MSDTSGQPSSLDIAVTDLLRATGLLVRRIRAEMDPGDLTWSEAAILARLDEAGPMTTAELARRESVKPQSVGASLAVLEREGLVQRQPHPSDGRQILVGVSEKGAAMRQRNTIRKRQWISAAMAKLDASEQQTVIAAAALMRRLADL